jgi:hypothetical protein
LRPLEQLRAALSPVEGRRDVSLAEIEYRGWQEAAKWLERVSGPPRVSTPASILGRRAPQLASPDAALALLRDALPDRFFPGATDSAALAEFTDRCSGRCRELLDEADVLLDGRFNLLGYQGLRFGDPPDWHLDPVSGRRAPLLHWSRIDPLNPEVVGDSKVIWELNRHQWLVRLAHAYAVSGDERYARACTAAIDSWLDANPPSTGINWASSLEVAYRLIAWCWTLALVRNSPAVSGEWAMKVLAAVWRHASHIRRYLSYYFSPNTHLTGEALGLFYAGTLFPEFRDAAGWRRAGARILIDESARQILQDGVYFEQSTCYQRYTIDIYLHFIQLAARNRIATPPDVAQRLERMVDFLLAVRQPDGSMPQIGDADGGCLLPLSSRKPDDGRGMFALAASVFGRSDFAWAAEGESAEVCWLLGSEGLRSLDRVTPLPPIAAPSKLFAAGGYAVLRSGWQRDAHVMIVDTGRLGCPTSNGHGRADLLSVQGAIFGERCLVDAGTGCYTSSSRSQLRAWRTGPDMDVVDARHDAYLQLPEPVVHRRRVFFVKPDYWVIVDDVVAAAEPASLKRDSAKAGSRSATSKHQLEVRFQFAPLTVTVGRDDIARAETPGGHVLWAVPFASSAFTAEVREGWISPDYGQREPAPALVYSTIAPLPWRMVTLLLPETGSPSAAPAVHEWRDDGGLPIAITFDDPHVRYRRHFAF